MRERTDDAPAQRALCGVGEFVLLEKPPPVVEEACFEVEESLELRRAGWREIGPERAVVVLLDTAPDRFGKRQYRRIDRVLPQLFSFVGDADVGQEQKIEPSARSSPWGRSHGCRNKKLVTHSKGSMWLM